MFKIMSDGTLPVTQQIDKILELGCELFSEDIGIVSRIEGNQYIVKNVYSHNGAIKPDEQFELQNTFCAITLQADGPLGIDDVMRSRWNSHPCIKTGLKSYIGVPLIVSGQRFGTLNFSSADPKVSHFSSLDLEFINTLGQWITTAIGQSQMISQLQTETIQDDLTGLKNRRGLLNVLARYANSFDDYALPFTILFIDLDKFKTVNDTFGHTVGDRLLQQVARRLEKIKRPTDTIGRFGGDEFLAVLEDVPIDKARDIANRIKNSLEAPFMLDGNEIKVRASIGIAMGTGKDEIAELIEMADKAMYEAKGKEERISDITKKK